MSLKTPRKTAPVSRCYIMMYFRILQNIYDVPISHGGFVTNSEYSFRKGKKKKRVIHDGDTID